jgi:CRP-like cAMP-binding protein
MQPVPCSVCPLRKKSLFLPLTPEEIAFMEDFKIGELTVAAGSTVLMEGSNSPQLFTVFSGMGTRSKVLVDGQRQVINFLFPGDFIGLQAGLMGEMKHSVEATTPMRLCVFARSNLWTLFQVQAARAYDLTWIAAVEEHFLGETIASLGQRDARQRVAWALLRIHQRLAAVEMIENDTVPMPYRQQDLADALGLSLVHTNKTLAYLRDHGIANWSRQQLSVPDKALLARVAGTDLEPPERRPIL